MTPLPASPFLYDLDQRFVFNEQAFIEALGIPASPEPEYLAEEIEQILKALFKAAA